MQRLALLVVWAMLGFLPAQQIVGTYRGNDLEGLRRAVQQDQANAGLRLRLAQALLRRGREVTHPDDQEAILNEVQGHFQKVLADHPDAQIPLRLMALDAYATRRFEQVIEHGNRLLTLVPGDLQVSRRVLKALVQLKRTEDAVAFLLAWLKRGTVPSLGVLQGLISTLSMNEEFRNRFQAALEAASSERPRDVQLLLYQAILSAEIGRMEKAWKLMHDAEALGLCDARSGERHTLVRSLRAKSVEHGANPVSYTGTELPKLDEAMGRAPEHAGVILRRARVLDLAERRDEALAAYGKALEVNPDLWPALFRRGELLLEAGRSAEAAKCLARARALYPDLILVRLLEALARARAGEIEATVALLGEDARVNEPVNRSRAAMEALAGHGPDALRQLIAHLEAASAADPLNPYACAYLAEAYVLAKDTAAARRYALDCERRGLAGPDARPHRLLYKAFGEPLPEGYPRPFEPAGASGGGGRSDGSRR